MKKQKLISCIKVSYCVTHTWNKRDNNWSTISIHTCLRLCRWVIVGECRTDSPVPMSYSRPSSFKGVLCLELRRMLLAFRHLWSPLCRKPANNTSLPGVSVRFSGSSPGSQFAACTESHYLKDSIEHWECHSEGERSARLAPGAIIQR